MADLTITAAEVAPVRVLEQSTGPAHEAIDAGEAVYLVAATGKYALADENAAWPADRLNGIAISSANQANITITVVKKGIIDLGDALDAMDYGDPVYLSATAGKLSDVSVGDGRIVGQVVPGWGATTADKLLSVDLSVAAIVMESA